MTEELKQRDSQLLSYKLQWLCNGATPQCKDKGPFLVFGILGIFLRKKAAGPPAKRRGRQL